MKTQILKATLLAFIIFFSCHQVSQQHPILEQAEKVMSEHPDYSCWNRLQPQKRCRSAIMPLGAC